MSMLERNLALLQSRYPELVRLIDDYSEDGPTKVTYTKNNEPNIALMLGEEQIFLHSRYNAVSEAQKWLASIEDQLTRTEQVLLFGTGMGYFLEAVLRHPKVKGVILVEPDVTVFNTMVRFRDVRNILSDSRIQMLAVGSHESVFAELANYISTRMLGTLSFLVPPVYHRYLKESLNQLKGIIASAVNNEASNLQTYNKFQKTWLENILSNLPYTINNPSINVLSGLLQGKKVIIVGSGPSLQKDIHYLKKLKDKCFIIAAGSSIQSLQYYEITPDLAITMDGGEVNSRVYENIDTTLAPLLFITQSHYRIPEIYRGQLMYALFEEDPVSEYLYRDRSVAVFRPTASVTGTALQVAAYLGANEIYLMGQDLSYPGGQFYSPGVEHLTERVKQNALKDADELVDNVDGGKNATTKIMTITRQNIEMNIKVLSTQGIKVINTSKGGAVLEGTEWVSMDELYPQLQWLSDEKFEFSSKIISLSPSERLDRFNITISKLQYILKQIDDMSKKLNQLYSCLKKLKKNISIRNVKKLKQSLTEINDHWQWITSQDCFNTFYSFGLAQQVKKYMKYVPLIVEAKDPFQKAELIEEHLGELVHQLKTFEPELREIIIGAIDRLNMFRSEVGGASSEHQHV